MSTLTRTFGVLVLTLFALSSRAAQANETSSEKQPLLRPIRVGLCGGLSPDCYFLSGKIELAHRYVAVNAHLSPIPTVVMWGGGSIKVYPGGAVHRRTISLRPYLFVGKSGSKDRYVGDSVPGGGIGADIHVGPSKKLIIQPSLSWVHRNDLNYSLSSAPPIGGSVSLMRGHRTTIGNP